MTELEDYINDIQEDIMITLKFLDFLIELDRLGVTAEERASLVNIYIDQSQTQKYLEGTV